MHFVLRWSARACALAMGFACGSDFNPGPSGASTTGGSARCSHVTQEATGNRASGTSVSSGESVTAGSGGKGAGGDGTGGSGGEGIGGDNGAGTGGTTGVGGFGGTGDSGAAGSGMTDAGTAPRKI